MILLGKIIFADVIVEVKDLRGGRPGSVRVALHPMTVSLKGTEEETQTQRRSHVETEAETGGMPGAPGAGRGGKAPPWSLWRERGLGHLDLRRLVSKTWECECLFFKP